MIKLTKEKIIYIDDHKKEPKEKIVKSLISFLNDCLEIEENFTLEDLFRILEEEKKLYDIIFSSSLGGFPLQFYIDDINKTSATKKTKKRWLEISQTAEYWDAEASYFEPDTEIQISCDFHEIAILNKDDKVAGLKKGEKCSFSLSFQPLNKIKYLSLKLNYDFIIYDMRETATINELIKTKKSFTVYDVINAILYEISFFGKPKARDKEKKQVFAEVEEMQKELKEHPEKYIGLEEFKKTLKLSEEKK